MIISEFLGTLAAKLASLGVAAKAGLGLGVAATATAGAVAVLPDAATNAVEPRTNPPVSIPAPETSVATPAPVGAQVEEQVEPVASATPGSNANAAATGLDRARQTPAADHIPSFVPGPPSRTPGSNANAAATGLNRARQTPAADHIPSFVPGPPSGTPDATGRDTADQTPAGARRPR